jgi:uncharacterized membrane protein YqjE
MSSSSDIVPAPPEEAAQPESQPQDPLPANWREALMSLVATRLTLIELEAKDAAKQTARRGSSLAAAVGCIVFAWALLLAGGVSIIAKSADLPWDQVAIGAAVLHLLGGIILARLARPSAATAFPITRAEFQKDREWIENFQKTKKSND